MMKRTLAALLLALISLATSALAGGPAYSKFGIGNLYYFGGSRAYAMGGVAVGLIGDGFINGLNPAGLARISNARFSGSFDFTNYSSNDLSGTSRYARGDFGGLSVAIPIAKDYGIVLLGEMVPYSTVDYAINRSDTQYGITSNQQNYGSGGISQFTLGSSVSITDRLHAGLNMNYLAGTIRQITKLQFVDNSFANSELDQDRHYSGFMFTMGATYEGVSDLFNWSFLKPLVLGAVVGTPANLDLREQHFTSTATSTVQNYDTTFTRYGNADIPLFLALGASYTLSDRYVIAADFAMQDWSSAKSFDVHPNELRKSTRVGVGFQILPRKDASTYFDHVVYRAGFYYNASYMQIDNQANGIYQAINGTFVSAGLGLPVGPDTHLNLGFEYGVNGTTNYKLQKDTIFRLTASISASELWFARFEED